MVRVTNVSLSDVLLKIRDQQARLVGHQIIPVMGTQSVPISTVPLASGSYSLEVHSGDRVQVMPFVVRK